MRDLVRRIDHATPPGRDRAVDALRALAILGVVLGHWLVTALVADSGTVHGAGPLQYMPRLIPISWLFRTLAVFFLVGGHVGARSYASARAQGVPYGQWVGARMARLFRPVAAVLTVWTVAAVAMLVSGVGPDGGYEVTTALPTARLTTPPTEHAAKPPVTPVAPAFASGFLLKDASAAELAQAVRVVAAGDALLAPNITKRLIAEFSRMTGAPRAPLIIKSHCTP